MTVYLTWDSVAMALAGVHSRFRVPLHDEMGTIWWLICNEQSEEMFKEKML